MFLAIDLLPFAKLLVLLAIDHSSSKRRIIFVSWLLKFPMFWLLCNVHGCALPHSFSLITRSGLASFPGCQDSCGIIPNGPAGPVPSFNIRQGLKCYHVALTPTLTMWLLCSNCTFPRTTKYTFREEMWQLSGWQLSGCILVVSPSYWELLYIIYFVNYHTNKLKKY